MNKNYAYIQQSVQEVCIHGEEEGKLQGMMERENENGEKMNWGQNLVVAPERD